MIRGGVIMSHSYPSDISREQFARILPTLESARRRTKPRTVDLYDVFCGVLYLLKSGCQWRMLPADFPNWRTCYQYFGQWSERPGPGQDSILERVLKNRLARSDKAMDGKSRPAAASWTPRASRTRTVPIARAMTRARRCPDQASHRGGHARIAPCDTRDYRRRYRSGWGFGDV